MNTSEWEQRIKGLLDDREYTPDDVAWNKMQQALAPSSSTPKRLFLVPAWKVAATVTALLVLGGSGYLLLKERHQPDTHTATASPAASGKKYPTPSTLTLPIARTASTVPSRAKAANATQQSIAGKTIYRHTAEKEIVPQQPEERKEKMQEPVVTANQKLPDHPIRPDKQQEQTQYPFRAPVYKEQKAKSLNLGIAANIGKPSLGNIQYNVGIVARKQLSGRFFAEANVSLASTQVNYSQLVTMSERPGDAGAGFANTQNLNVSYASNIIAVGFAPAIGVTITRNISFSTGADVYKILNRKLNIQNNLEAEGLSDASALQIPAVSVTDIDAGVKAQLDYRFGCKLSLSTLYRQGLTQFIIIDGKSAKNSSFNIGLKYNLGK